MKNKQEYNNGFTLIELLVVIAIIGLLVSVVMVFFPETMKKARDGRRLEDMSNIQTALQVYLVQYGQYPDPCHGERSYGECEDGCAGWDTSTVDNDGDGKPFIDALVDEGIVEVVPGDPIGDGTCGGFNYRYYRYAAGSYGCDPSRGAFFVLGVNDMESSGRPYPNSPGWSCSNRNWQDEFDWVTGGFEK